MPQTRSRCFSERAIEAMRIDEVLEARMASGETTASNSPNNFCLTSRFSNTASITMWQPLRSLRPPATVKLASVLARSVSLRRPLATRPFNVSRMAALALAAPPSTASNMMALMPPCAVTCAMPRPMAPVPTTPTARSERLMSRVMDPPPLSLACVTGRLEPAGDLVDRRRIVDRGRHLPGLAVGDLLHGAAQDLARAGLGQAWHDDGRLEEGHRSDALAHHLHHF